MKIVPISAFRDNYIWALCSARECAVIDPGEAAPVTHFLDEHELSLTTILVTHHHNDHTGGIAALCKHWPHAAVFGPAAESIPCRTRALRDRDEVNLGPLGRFTVLSVPGHTEGHIAYYGESALFCGDTLFAAGCGRILGGTAAQLYASLQRLAALPADTRVYCAHEYTLSNLRFAAAAEPDNAAINNRQQTCTAQRERGEPTLPSTLEEELKTNPFLRCDQPTIRRTAHATAGHDLHSEEEVFAALRAWKDIF